MSQKGKIDGRPYFEMAQSKHNATETNSFFFFIFTRNLATDMPNLAKNNFGMLCVLLNQERFFVESNCYRLAVVLHVFV